MKLEKPRAGQRLHRTVQQIYQHNGRTCEGPINITGAIVEYSGLSVSTSQLVASVEMNFANLDAGNSEVLRHL